MVRTTTIAPIVALAAALALAACGGGEEPAAEPVAPPAATEPATTVSGTTDAPTTAAETEPGTTEAETEAEPPATTEKGPDVDIHIEVADGERIGGKGRIEAKRGDRVRIEVAVDAPQEIHVHGYELEKEAAPGRPAVFTFRAELEGIFEIESHPNDVVIADLVVEP